MKQARNPYWLSQTFVDADPKHRTVFVSEKLMITHAFTAKTKDRYYRVKWSDGTAEHKMFFYDRSLAIHFAVAKAAEMGEASLALKIQALQ